MLKPDGGARAGARFQVPVPQSLAGRRCRMIAGILSVPVRTFSCSPRTLGAPRLFTIVKNAIFDIVEETLALIEEEKKKKKKKKITCYHLPYVLARRVLVR